MLEEGLGEYKGIDFRDIRKINKNSVASRSDSSDQDTPLIDSASEKNRVLSIANMSSVKPAPF